MFQPVEAKGTRLSGHRRRAAPAPSAKATALGWAPALGVGPRAPFPLLMELSPSQSSHTGKNLSHTASLSGISPCPPQHTLDRSTHQHIHMGKSYWRFDCSGMVWLKPMTGPFLTHSFRQNIIFVPKIRISHFSGFLKLASVPPAFPTSDFEVNLN